MEIDIIMRVEKHEFGEGISNYEDLHWKSDEYPIFLKCVGTDWMQGRLKKTYP